MSRRPELDTKNPPGQIVGTDYLHPPKYLKDVIKRIQGEEEPMKLPTPIAGPSKALEDLVGALLNACDVVEEEATAMRALRGGLARLPELRTALIRKIIEENT